MAQQYSLKWNNHQPNFISTFAMLRNSQTLIDVTLAAEGQYLNAHKVVLSACSPYFHTLFINNPSRHPIVILKDVAFSDLITIVDFMYYGEVNITQAELPQMLDSAKSLRVKGLTETESTSVMRSQSDLTSDAYEASGEASSEQIGEQSGEQTNEPSTDPANEPTTEFETVRRSSTSPPAITPIPKRRRRRLSSNISTIHTISDENEQSLEIRDGITLSSVPRRREFTHEHNNTQQNAQPQNISIDDLNIDHNITGLPQGGQWSMMEHTYPRYTNSCFGGGTLPGEGGMYMGGVMHGGVPSAGGAGLEGLQMMPGLRVRRVRQLKRQPRVEERGTRRQASEPFATSSSLHVPGPSMRKHNSYPQFANRIRLPAQSQSRSLSIRTVSEVDRQTSSASSESPVGRVIFGQPVGHRASHTPAVRSGPPLSCNYCWNTVDECGRILRRKTQYHCPECRTNLCIVPCFHEYHEAEAEVSSAR